MHSKNPLQKKDVHKDAKKLRELISEDKINALAKSSGWLNRERKFTGMTLLKVMVFISNGHYQLSLRERCYELLSHGIKLSKQALDKRLNDKASVFIKSVLEQVLHLKLIEGSRVKFLSGFSGISIIDATSFQLPEHLSNHYKGSGGGASKSAVKTHYCLSITGQGHQMGLEVVDGVGPDTGSGLVNVQKGALLLFDLGYFSFSNLERIACSKGYYLSRIKYSTQVWIKTTQGFKRLDWQKHMARMQVGQIEELQVYLGDEKKVNTRLIIEKIPDHIAAEKRRNLKTNSSRKSKSFSQGRLAFCSVNAFVSNTTKVQLPKEHVRTIYGLRWQIELYFKTWKSYMNIDKIEKMNIHRFNCTHYGTLIYIILSCKVFLCFKHYIWKKQHKELSELKAMKFLAKHRDWIWELLYLPIEKARERLETLQNILNTNGIKERKKGTLTPYQTIERILS